MDRLARLEAIEEIKQLKGGYFCHMDRRDWHAWRALFADDAVMDVSGQFPDAPDPSIYVTRGGDAILAMVRAALEGAVTMHHGYTPLITIESDDTASGIWAMEDILHMADGSVMHGYGHYHDRYRKIDGAWRIAHVGISRLKVDYQPAIATAA